MSVTTTASTWDETIVPALRKRLESESRVLAKRMSFASQRSLSPDIAPSPPIQRKSSAIPRPSLQHAPRSRTHSQPPSPQLPTPDPSRPTSPRVSDVKPTRIPIAARTRTTSTSSHHAVKSCDASRPPTPPIPSIRHQASAILNEPPPFPTSSVRSRADPRPSADSEERPFEHWYRGDVHRNGGVGEFRVAKHLEMLQIANYGHSLRARQSRDNDAPRRRRADSVDRGTHESLSLEDPPTAMVFDEAPLTDIEPDTEPETFYDAYAGVEDQDDTISSPPPGLPATSHHRQTPIPPDPPKHVPTTSDPPRSIPPRTSADSTVPAPRTRTPRATSPASHSSDQSHTKRRAKSPAASSPSTPKKPRARVKTPPSTTMRKDDPRISIAAYPTPEGDMVNAIPTWTQPVQKSGNWDEVVLPVVARKRGLDGQYEQADGSPKPMPPPVKPAPGTFGFDYTKYRPPRLDEEIPLNHFGHIPEQAEEDVPPLAESPKLKPPSISIIPHPVIPEEPIRQDLRQVVPKPPDSPAPFSRYHLAQPPQPSSVPTINVTRPSTDIVDYREHEYEDATGGCCKCVIM